MLWLLWLSLPCATDARNHCSGSCAEASGLQQLFQNNALSLHSSFLKKLANAEAKAVHSFAAVAGSVAVANPLVCTFGYSVGLAAEWWLQNTNATVISFSSGNSAAAPAATNFTQREYPGRALLMIGPPAQGTPSIVCCDQMLIAAFSI
jgi:hypothetical protein